MKLTQALTSIIFGTSVPSIYSHGISGNVFGAVGLKSYHSYPSTMQSLSETNLFQSRRRAQLGISQECVNRTEQIGLEDSRYNVLYAPFAASCPIQDANQDGTFVVLVDRGDCDDSEFLAFCDANYQSVKFPNVKMACEPNPEEDLDPTPRLIYAYDIVDCVDLSCPSDLSEFSPEAVSEFLFRDAYNSTFCTVELLEEGEEPQIKFPDPIVPDNLSQECMDQIDAFSTLANADEEWVNITSNAPGCGIDLQWMTGNDTFIVVDLCDEGKETMSKKLAYCDAMPNHQPMEFGVMKATCPRLSANGAGTLHYVFTQTNRCKGLSCPANPSDWSITDFLYTDNPGLIESSCEWERIGVEDIPKPPETAAPATENDAPAAPEDETGGVDAPTAPEDETGGVDAPAAPEDEDPASVDDESSASRFAAGMTIALPLAAVFRLLV